MRISKRLNWSFAVIMVSFVIIVLPFYRDDMLGTLLVPWTKLTAWVTLALIHFTGMEAMRMATVISHPTVFINLISQRVPNDVAEMFEPGNRH